MLTPLLYTGEQPSRTTSQARLSPFPQRQDNAAKTEFKKWRGERKGED